MTNQETINKAVEWAVNIANDDSHGYSQVNRNGPDYDCSSLIISAWESAGLRVKEAGATYTGNMRAAFKKCGFVEVPLATRRKGDILLNELHHVAMMVDSSRLVHASISENGTTTGKSGDQTGKEICVTGYYYHRHGWDCMLRYVGSGSDIVTVETELIKHGVTSEAVRTLQLLLNAKAKENLVADGECGTKTKEAIIRYQRAHSLIADGECGKNTWYSILNK